MRPIREKQRRAAMALLALAALALAAGIGTLEAFLATQGTLTVKVTTVSFGGKYADKNVGAIWVTDAQDRFVKTLELWARKRKKHLVKWLGASGGDVTDAVTGATIRSHREHTATWNCTDVNGSVVPDGVYKVYAEFTEENSASSGKAGKWYVAEFTKGPDDQTLRPADQTYFKSIELVYTAGGGSQQAASISGTVRDTQTQVPLASAVVQLLQNSKIILQGTTDANGSYLIENIQAGTYVFQASKQGYHNFTQTLTVNAGDQLTGKNVDLQPLSAQASISGTVYESNTTTPIAGASVQLRQNAIVVISTSSDANGGYRLANIAAGTYTLFCSRDGYSPYSENLNISDGEIFGGKDIYLQKVSNGARLTGMVVNAATNKPLPNVSVQLKVANQIQYQTTTNSNGEFQFIDIQAGTYALVALGQGFAGFSENISLAAGQSVAGKVISLPPSTSTDTTPPSPPRNVRVRQANQ